MSDIISFVKERVAVKLALAVTLALAAAYLSVAPLTRFFNHVLDNRFYSGSYLARQENIYIEKLQEFVERKQISSEQILEIDRWVKSEKAFSLLLVDEGQVIYDSDSMLAAAQGMEQDHIAISLRNNLSAYEQDLSGFSFHGIHFCDGKTLDAAITYYGFFHYYTWVSNLCMILAFCIFLSIFLFFIHKKVRYIQKLADELRILEGGDLHYHVTEEGADELYHLAAGINQMRLSILRNQENEEKNSLANQKLVTALSHDLRTPLTSLIGYLEVMTLNKYKSREQLMDFLEKSQNKAYQIRDLSNKLFQYFLVSQQMEEDYSKEEIGTSELLYSLKDDQIFELQRGGFKVICQFDAEEFSGVCYLDMEFMQRVLDNLLSNIRRYADPKENIYIIAQETDGYFLLEFKNKIGVPPDADESSGIGTKVCEMIISKHGGSFSCRRTGDEYRTKLKLPLVKNGEMLVTRQFTV